MAVEWSTIEFETLVREDMLMEEPLVGKERATLRYKLGVAASVLVAACLAFLLGMAIGGAAAWYEMTNHTSEIENWRVQ